MSTQRMTPDQVRQAGIRALTRELGAAGMIRFLQQFRPGSGDYTAQRHQWLGKQDAMAIASRTAQARSKKKPVDANP